MNVVCTSDNCDFVISSKCVFYEGAALPYSGISTNDTVETVIQKLSAAIEAGGGGTVVSVTASSPLLSSGGTTPNISMPVATGSTNGYLSSSNWNTFNNKQDTITLTTVGTSGVATFVGSILNIPQYQGSGLGWLLASGGTLTGINTITSNAKNQLLFNGTWTATAANDYHLRISPTITGQGATNPNTYRAFYLTPSFVAGDNSQTFTALSVDATFDDNAKTGVIKQLISLRSAGTSRLSLSSAGDLAVTGNTHTFNAASGGTVALKASAILDVNSDTSYVLIRGRGTSTKKSVEFNTIAPLGDAGNVWQFTGTTFSTTGAVTQSLTNVRINPTYLAANVGATSTIRGIHYSPTETVLGTFTHYAFLIDTPTGLSGFGTATPNARVDIRGINNSTALLVTDDGGNVIINFGESGGSRVIGLFGSTPVGQLTSGANLTNNVTSGGTDDQIDNWTDLSTYATDAAAIRNAIYQLARKLKQINDGLRLRGDFN